MHELSIAQSLIGLVERYAPPGEKLNSVHVHVGPLQAIEPAAMRLAWAAATSGTPYEGARLTLEFLPWHVRCLQCGREWETAELVGDCDCGSQSVAPIGGDELTLDSIDVEEEAPDACETSNRLPKEISR